MRKKWKEGLKIYKSKNGKKTSTQSLQKKIKIIIGREEGYYKKNWIKETKKGLETMARFRFRSETVIVKYWKKEGEKRCRLRKEEVDSKHILVNAKAQEVGSRIQQMEQGRKTFTILKKIG